MYVQHQTGSKSHRGGSYFSKQNPTETQGWRKQAQTSRVDSEMVFSVMN